MTLKFALFMFLAACDPTADVQPDAGTDAHVITVLYPCNTQYEVCQAAKMNAEAVCELRFTCDPLYEAQVGHDQCVANVMSDICSTRVCNASPYDRFQELDACISEFRKGPCDKLSAPCEL